MREWASALGEQGLEAIPGLDPALDHAASERALDDLGRSHVPIDVTFVAPPRSSNVKVSGPPCAPMPGTSNRKVQRKPSVGVISR